MRLRWHRLACLPLLLCLASQATASQEEVAGRSDATVAGQVRTSDGTLLPHALVVLVGPLPSGARHDTVTDDAARFRVGGLAAGTYRVSVVLPGVRAVSDVEITVADGETRDIVIRLGLFSYEVGVEVLAEPADAAGPFVEDSTSGLRQLSNRALTHLPLPAEQALDALPLFPGVVRGPAGLISIGGTLPTDSAFLFNGADLIDPYSGRYRLAVPLEAVESVQLYTGVYAAAYGDNLGGVVDVRTMPGGNSWRTEVASPFPRPWFRDGKLSGIRRANPRVRISGPLIEQRLNVSLAAGYAFERVRARDVPGEDGDHERFESWDGVAQIDWRPNPRNDLRVLVTGMPDVDGYVGIGGLMSASATSHYSRTTGAFIAEHQYRVDDRSFVQSLVQWNSRGFVARPTEAIPAPFIVIPDGYRGVGFHREDRDSGHWQAKSTYTRAFGTTATRHLLQAGIDLHRLSTSGGQQNGRIEVRDAAGSLLRTVTFAEGADLSGSKWEASLFVQDRWRPSARFWIDAGLRAAWDGATGNARLAPRVGIAWDVLGNERTLLKASAGLLYRRVFLGEQLWEQLPTRIETTYETDGTTTVRRLVPTVADDLDAPRALLASVEISHRFSERLTARLRYSQRDTRKQIYFDRLPTAAATGGAQASDTVALALRSDGEATYQELELTGNWRLSDDAQLFLSYVHSRARGELNTFDRVAGERVEAVLRENRSGPTFTDTPDRVVLWGVLDLPWKLRLAPVVEWRRGFPYSVLREDQEYLGAANSERFPAYLSADVNITRAFRFFGEDFRGGLLIQNLSGHFNPRDVISNVASDRFGTFLNDYGRRFRLRFSASF